MEIFKDSSFITVLAQPISSTLLLPDEFRRIYGGLLTQEAFLRLEEKYGCCWNVEIARLDNGRFCFSNGWQQFVQGNPQICPSDFAIFHLINPLTFQVSIFGVDGLKKPSSRDAENSRDSYFIKVLAEPNSSTLLLPDEFVRKYSEMLPQEAFLKTEEKYGCCWNVEIARLDEDRFCFANGWPQFVQGNPQICPSDFAVFHFVNSMTFRVSIFGKDGLKKPSSTLSRPRPPSPPPPQDVENNRRSDCTERCESSTSKRRVEMNQRKSSASLATKQKNRVEMIGKRSFKYTSLASNQKYRIVIPSRLGEKMGLAVGKSITLRNKDGLSFPVLVRRAPGCGAKFFLGGPDWKNFWENNCLVVGNTLTFSILGDDFTTLHVF